MTHLVMAQDLAKYIEEKKSTQILHGSFHICAIIALGRNCQQIRQCG